MSWDVFKANMTEFLKNRNATASGVSSPEDMPAPFMIDVLDAEGNVIGQEFDGGEEGQAKELAEIAMKFADEYHLAILSAKQGPRPIVSAFHSSTLEPLKGAIFTAIWLALRRMQGKGDKPSTILMVPIGAAVVAYWAATMVPGSIAAVPLPPGYTSPSPGVQVLFPGNPRPIVKGFKDAFSKYDNEEDFNTAVSKMLDDIIKGFKDHLASVSGIYIGLVPAGPGVLPLVTPWKGITV